ncbi:MAG: Arc family DNA binding domain-containing protein [Bacteroidia bacterium]|nr:Arc family DNA binding domain-containing protein [Bacteroidia bacterium]
MKKQIALRLEPHVIGALEKWAADEFRSVNGQLEWIISNALREAGRLKEPEADSPEESQE